MEALGALAILFGFVLAVVIFGVWIWNLVEVLVTPGPRWAAAGQSKALWLLVLLASFALGVALLGSVLYLAIARPRVRARMAP